MLKLDEFKNLKFEDLNLNQLQQLRGFSYTIDEESRVFKYGLNKRKFNRIKEHLEKIYNKSKYIAGTFVLKIYVLNELYCDVSES